MKKNTPKPIRARPTRGPTTAPAIQALLSFFSVLSSGKGDVGPGDGVVDAGVELGVTEGGVDRGEVT
jgi:hypothetical protein